MPRPKKETSNSAQPKRTKKQVASKPRKRPAVAKKTAAKKPRTSTEAKTAQSSESTAKKSGSVTLPSNMSQRAITKTMTYKAYFSGYGQRIVVACGLLCVLFGSAVALFSTYNLTPPLQVANVCLAGDCELSVNPSFDTTIDPNAQLDEGAVDAEIDTVTETLEYTQVEEKKVDVVDPATQSSNVSISTPEAPRLNVIESVPAVVNSDASFTVATEFTRSLEINAKSPSSGLVPLTVEELANKSYRVHIPGASMEPGEYKMTAYAKSTNGLGTFSFPIGGFTILAAEVVPEETVTELRNEEPQVSEVGPAKNINTPLRIGLVSTNLRGAVNVTIAADEPVSQVELYVRRQSSTQQQLVGLASTRFTTWDFQFYTTDVPDGSYIMSANGITTSGDVVRSNNVSITIDNTVYQPSTPTYEYDDSITGDSTNRFISTDIDLTASERAAVEAESADYESTISLTDEAQSLLESLLTDFSLEVSEVARNYAAAVATNDATVVTLAHQQMDTLQERLVNQVLNDQSKKHLVSGFRDLVVQHFAELREKTTAFEVIRQERTSQAEMIDTDEDGITDADERNLYNTDPNQADTDGDGFIDSVEIMRGFDPLDSNEEATITYQSPRETVARVVTDTLTVVEVEPFIETASEEVSQPPVQAVIRGTALPNSFVTLFIFSEPIIVTVRTDASGAYSYRLEKELADGSHEVYAAITDNTGTIVARSTPFQFIKEAQAFTNEEAEEVMPIVGATDQQAAITDRVYATIIGLSILAFGLLLLIVGIRTRSKSEVEFVDTTKDATPA